MKKTKMNRSGFWYRPKKDFNMKKEKHYSLDCRYCEKPTKLVGGDVIYPYRADLKQLKFWLCNNCNAWVGCHKPGHNKGNGTMPLGEVADSELRRLRSAAHFHFDKLWRSQGKSSRTSCYKELSEYLGIDIKETHIGIFNIDECKKTIKFSKEQL